MPPLAALPSARADGFSNGAMIAYLMSIELRRRRLRAPCRLLVAGRGAPHIIGASARTLLERSAFDDAQTIAWAEEMGILAPASQRIAKVSARFAPVARSGFGWIAPAGSVPEGLGVDDDADRSAYATGPPRLIDQTKLVAILGTEDEMWPCDRFIARWADVAATAALFRAVPLAGVPHHLLQSHASTQAEVFGELAAALPSLS